MADNRPDEIREALVAELNRLSSGREPLDLIEDISTLEAWVGEYTRARIEDAREAGASWADIADLLGVSKQAVHKRFTAKPATPKYRRLELKLDFGGKKKKH